MAKKETNYEAAMRRIEEIVDNIEGGEMELDSLTEQLAEANKLIALCEGKLKKVKDDVSKLLEDGKE